MTINPRAYKGCLSFCFWGELYGPYFDGIESNAARSAELYSDWDIVIFLPRCSKNKISERLHLGEHVRLVQVDFAASWNGMFWRMLPVFWNDYTHICIRDLDSLVSRREADAVQAWISEDSDLHIMRDHPAHTAPIMGGMFGLKVNKRTRQAFRPIKKIILKSEIHREAGYWQIDQQFLARLIYPVLKDNATIHDPYYKRIDFPAPRDKPHLYVGRPSMKLGLDKVVEDESVLAVDQYLNQKAHQFLR